MLQCAYKTLALVLAWQLGAAEMGYFSKEEFVGGLTRLKAHDLPSLRAALIKVEKETQANTVLFNELYKVCSGLPTMVKVLTPISLHLHSAVTVLTRSQLILRQQPTC